MMKYLPLVVIILASSCSALYFHMGETEKKCFIEEIPDETMITGELFSSEKWMKINLIILLFCLLSITCLNDHI